jgi:hypothetical protein
MLFPAGIVTVRLGAAGAHREDSPFLNGESGGNV